MIRYHYTQIQGLIIYVEIFSTIFFLKRQKDYHPILREAPPGYINDPFMVYGAEEWKEEIYLGY